MKSYYALGAIDEPVIRCIELKPLKGELWLSTRSGHSSNNEPVVSIEWTSVFLAPILVLIKNVFCKIAARAEEVKFGLGICVGGGGVAEEGKEKRAC